MPAFFPATDWRMPARIDKNSGMRGRRIICEIGHSCAERHFNRCDEIGERGILIAAHEYWPQVFLMEHGKYHVSLAGNKEKVVEVLICIEVFLEFIVIVFIKPSVFSVLHIGGIERLDEAFKRSNRRRSRSSFSNESIEEFHFGNQCFTAAGADSNQFLFNSISQR
jgi:hypothetical protein